MAAASGGAAAAISRLPSPTNRAAIPGVAEIQRSSPPARMINGNTMIHSSWVSRKASRARGWRIRLAQSHRKISGTRLCRWVRTTKW